MEDGRERLCGLSMHGEVEYNSNVSCGRIWENRSSDWVLWISVPLGKEKWRGDQPCCACIKYNIRVCVVFEEGRWLRSVTVRHGYLEEKEGGYPWTQDMSIWKAHICMYTNMDTWNFLVVVDVSAKTPWPRRVRLCAESRLFVPSSNDRHNNTDDFARSNLVGCVMFGTVRKYNLLPFLCLS